MRKLLSNVKKHRERRRLVKNYAVKHAEMLVAYNQLVQSYID